MTTGPYICFYCSVQCAQPEGECVCACDWVLALTPLCVIIQHRGRVSGVKGSVGGRTRWCLVVIQGEGEAGARFGAHASRYIDYLNWPLETSGSVCVCVLRVFKRM